jgi:hypothetical protein
LLSSGVFISCGGLIKHFCEVPVVLRTWYQVTVAREVHTIYQRAFNPELISTAALSWLTSERRYLRSLLARASAKPRCDFQRLARGDYSDKKANRPEPS